MHHASIARTRSTERRRPRIGTRHRKGGETCRFTDKRWATTAPEHPRGDGGTARRKSRIYPPAIRHAFAAGRNALAAGKFWSCDGAARTRRRVRRPPAPSPTTLHRGARLLRIGARSLRPVSRPLQVSNSALQPVARTPTIAHRSLAVVARSRPKRSGRVRAVSHRWRWPPRPCADRSGRRRVSSNRDSSVLTWGQSAVRRGRMRSYHCHADASHDAGTSCR
jgi:hypothetical protein